MNGLIATGPEHSGTGLLASILRTSGLYVLHRAMPHVGPDGSEEWWQKWQYPVHYFVVIVRRADVRNLSTVARGQSPDDAEYRYQRAIQHLSLLRPATWVSYEALVANPEPQIANLGQALSLRLSMPPDPIYDGNARWLGTSQGPSVG